MYWVRFLVILKNLNAFKEENKMITAQLTKYTKALNDLPEHIKSNCVDMVSTEAPTCNTPGCHAGLVSIVAQYLPELQECYNNSLDFDGERYFQEYKNNRPYSYSRWADALALYLGFQFDETEHTREALMRWVDSNPYYWGNLYGEGMFNSCIAFDQDTDFFPHSVIIDHFTAMSDRLNEKRGK